MTTDTLRQIFGTLRTPNGSPFPNKSLKWFRERRTAVAQGSSVVLDDPFFVPTDAAGEIETSVMAGAYLVLAPLSDADRYFRVVVPDQAGPFDISSLIDGPTVEPDDLTQFEALVAKAKAWANAPEDSVVEAEQYSAKHWAAKSEDEKLAAQQARAGAETAELNAETARDAAFVNALVYADTAAGLAATTAGQQFQIVSGDEIIRYRHDAGPVATEVARYPAASRLDPFIQSAPLGYDWAVVDEDGRMAVGITSGGVMEAAAAEIGELTADEIGVTGSDVTMKYPTPYEYTWAIIDQDGRAAVGVTDEGQFKASDIVATTLNGVSVQSIISPDANDASLGDQDFMADITHLISYGQSLSVGVGTFSAITTTQRFDNLRFVGGVRAQDADATGVNTTAKYGSLVPLIETGPGAESAYETPMGGVTDAVKELIASENGIVYTQHQYQLLASSPGDGGRTIAELANQPGVFYTRLLDDVTFGLTRAQEAGKSYKVGAIFWTQGESDGGNTDYATELSALRSALDADIKAITGQPDDVQMICYQLPRPRQSEYFLEAMALDPLITIACPTYQLAKSDGVHLTAQSSKIMGAYYGLAYKRRVIDGQDAWKPCMAISHFRQGNIVDVKFNVPSGMLTFDTTAYPLQTGYGFRLFGTDGTTELTVTDVSITKHDTVRITAAATIPAGALLRYASYDPEANATDRDITGGNLRDTYGETAVLDLGGLNHPMHNWALLFARTL